MKNSPFAFLLLVLVFDVQTSMAQVRLSAEEAKKLIIANPTSVYSDLAKKMQAQGEVKVEISVAENGRVNKVHVLSGNPSLLTSAIEIGKQYKFKPYLIAGKPTFFMTSLGIFFSLGSSKDEVKNEEEIARRYFTQSDKCRSLIKEKSWSAAETVCKLAVSIAEQLPDNRAMGKYSAYKYVSITLLWQKQYQHSIEYSNKALEVTKNKLGETDSETGDIYFIQGLASATGVFDKAVELYEKAEKSYRAAFEKIDDEEIRQYYPRKIRDILEAHLYVAEQTAAKDNIETVKKRLAQLKKQFGEY